jgi:hypothetical protein
MRCPPLPLVDAAADLDAVRANDGVALFLARAEAATGSFTLDGAAASAIAEICARLDGLPLAIELAAARVAVLPPPVLLRRLDQRLPLLTGGARDVDPRQRTLRAAIEWSYELLDVGQRKLFERLSVFVDGCRFEAVEAVCDHERDVGLDLLDGLQDLVDKSLLRQRPDPDGDPRFWLLETIREYGLERLREHGQFDAVAQAHADHYLRWPSGVATRTSRKLSRCERLKRITKICAPRTRGSTPSVNARRSCGSFRHSPVFGTSAATTAKRGHASGQPWRLLKRKRQSCARERSRPLPILPESPGTLISRASSVRSALRYRDRSVTSLVLLGRCMS